MYLASDNTGPAHPEVIDALVSANEGFSTPYGDDALMDQVTGRIRDVFEAPKASVYLVSLGTAANALALATLSQPWQAIFCTPLAHIHTDECNAPEFFTGGAKLSLVGEGDKMTPEALTTAIEGWTLGDVHVSQRGPVALTQATEMGRVYSVAEITALATVARDHGLPTYMDGARFANALVTQNCTPAEMTWKAGLDAVSLGGTKNGCLGVEAVVFFNPENAWEFELRRKRSAHLISKHRYLSAQMLAYLSDDLWLRSARQANANAARLAEGLHSVPGCAFLAQPQANMIFARLPRATHQRLHAAGAVYGLHDGPLDSGAADEPLTCRLVCDWSIGEEQIASFVEIAQG